MSGARIQILPETLANQIAAGEVIERPAAVMKELIENALDAGASNVEVDLLDGGCKLVRVRDDGHGMGREDAVLSLQRHATSKLRSKEDLFGISTYGFRGEALPSIAAVSRFRLLTCEPGALAGTAVEVEAGRVLSVVEAAAPTGTTIEVRDLFWNVPARKKFLKRPQAEQAQVLETLVRLALPRPGVSFTARTADRVLLRLPAGIAQAAFAQRAEEALGRDARGNLLPFDASVRAVRAHGLAASPALERSNARSVWLFVNGRAVRDRHLLHAVLRAYGEVMPQGRYPAALVFLEVPLDAVDVNVHPAKAEVRLADARAAHEAIVAGLRDILARGAWLQLEGGATYADSASDPVEHQRQDLVVRETGATDRGGLGLLDPGALAADDRAARVADALERYAQHLPATWWMPPRTPSTRGPGGSTSIQRPDPGPLRFVEGGPFAQSVLLAPAPYFAGLRYLGQLHGTYLVCEGPRGLVLIDQHAAHERMNYQRLRRAAAERSVPRQGLLAPRVVELSASAAAIIAQSSEALAEIGLDVEPFGGASAAIKALPEPLAGLPDRALASLLTDLAEELSRGSAESLERTRDALLARAACHASVRAHDALTGPEAQALLDALDATDYGARCAHGRPVVAEWNTAEIEKRFGRDYESHGRTIPPEM